MKPFCFFSLLFILSCKQQKTDPVPDNTNYDSILKAVRIPLHNEKSDEQENHASNEDDSIHLEKALKSALRITLQNKNRKNFRKFLPAIKYKDNDIVCSAEYGNIFSNDRRHLIVKRMLTIGNVAEPVLFSDIYILKVAGFKKLLSDTAAYGYTSDTLSDINGDGYKDYMVSSYSGVGCCPRDARSLYLYNSHNGNFDAETLFNPDFDFKNRVIYQMEYGYPGELSIDKYKWVGNKLVQAESIFPEHAAETGNFPKPYRYRKITYPGEKEELLTEVPQEYKNTNMFWYFTMYRDK